MSQQGRYSILIEVQTGNAVSAINQLKGSLARLGTLINPISNAARPLHHLTISKKKS